MAHKKRRGLSIKPVARADGIAFLGLISKTDSAAFQSSTLRLSY